MQSSSVNVELAVELELIKEVTEYPVVVADDELV